jgi:hypothetical protein
VHMHVHHRSTLALQAWIVLIVMIVSGVVRDCGVGRVLKRMYRFQRAAGKNAFQLLSQHRNDVAAAFFLLAKQYVISALRCWSAC